MKKIVTDNNNKKYDKEMKFSLLKKKYDRCEVNIIEISNEILKNVNTKRYPLATYYRLFLAKFVPYLKRINT